MLVHAPREQCGIILRPICNAQKHDEYISPINIPKGNALRGKGAKVAIANEPKYKYIHMIHEEAVNNYTEQCRVQTIPNTKCNT